MKLGRSVKALLLATTIAGVAAPATASATDDITQNAVGQYELHYKNSTAVSYWFASPCDDSADHCIKVEEYSSPDTTKKVRWTSNAFWTVGSWIMAPVNGDRSCEDGTKYGVTYHYEWDAAKNTGWRSYSEPGLCDGREAGNVSAQFSLAKVGPPPTP